MSDLFTLSTIEEESVPKIQTEATEQPRVPPEGKMNPAD